MAGWLGESEIKSIWRHWTAPHAQGESGDSQGYERSGLSLLAFAGQHGLCYASLLRWRRRQGAEVSARAAPASGPGPRFIPVEIEEEVLVGNYVLRWPGGASLKIPRRFDRDSLRRLLAVLEVMR